VQELFRPALFTSLSGPGVWRQGLPARCLRRPLAQRAGARLYASGLLGAACLPSGYGLCIWTCACCISYAGVCGFAL